VLFSASDKGFAVFINDANDASSPTIRRLGNFIRVNPIFDGGGTIAARTGQAHSSGIITFHFNLSAADEFVTAPAKPSIIERIPLPQRIHFA
jgi:hypothetical protein